MEANIFFKKSVKSLLKKIIGVFLVIIGIIGLILPIMPGWIFLILGIGMIDKRYQEYVKRKFKFFSRY